MTFAEILLDVYRSLNYGDTPVAGVVTRVKARVNQIHREILAEPGLELLRDDTMTFASVASTTRYGLPSNIEFIKGIHERTNQQNLQARPLAWLRQQDPGLVASGDPRVFVPTGWMQVQTQPAAATGLWVASSAAGDITQDVYTETFRTGGYLAKATTRLSGTTRVAVGTFTDHIEVDKCYLSAVGVGTISLYDAAVGGNELTRIAIGQTSAHYYGIQLWPTPSAAITYYVDYTRQIEDMVNDTDEPLLPRDFQWLLTDGARSREYEKADDSRATTAAARVSKGKSDLKYRVLCAPDYKPVPGRGGVPSYSNLGGWYPGGTW